MTSFAAEPLSSSATEMQMFVCHGGLTQVICSVFKQESVKANVEDAMIESKLIIDCLEK